MLIHAVLAGLAALALIVAIVVGLAVERLCERVRLLQEQQDDDRNHFDDE